MDVHVVTVSWSTHEAQIRQIREAVFTDEGRLPVESDTYDAVATHVLALNEAGQPVGCVRLLSRGVIDRLAVLKENRNKGVGLRLLLMAVEEGKNSGCARVSLITPANRSGIFDRAGFLTVTSRFDGESSIQGWQQEMEQVLPIPFQSVGKIEQPELRIESAEAEPPAELMPFHGESSCLDGLQQCLTMATGSLQIYSQQLDHALFDDQRVVEEISRFIRRAPPITLQILLHTSQFVVSRGHRLLELARRMDSKIEIRRVPADQTQDEHSCVFWDDRGYWLLPDYREYEGYANHYDPIRVRKLSDRFSYLWSRSSADQELRVLRL